MFANALACFSFLFTLSILAAAMPGGQPPSATTKTITVTQTAAGPEPTSSCTTGPIQCCDSVTSVRALSCTHKAVFADGPAPSSPQATDPSATKILGLLDIVIEGLGVLVGLTCSPISVIGVGSGACSANAVCCQNNSFVSVLVVSREARDSSWFARRAVSSPLAASLSSSKGYCVPCEPRVGPQH